MPAGRLTRAALVAAFVSALVPGLVGARPGVVVAPCRGQIQTGVLPVWMRGGFVDPRPRLAHVVGARGQIGAVLFGWPLNAPPAEHKSNKILWVPRHTATGVAALRITLQRMNGLRAVGPPIRKVVPTGPGPSIVDVPSAGCWRATLTWSGRSDTLDLRYVAPSR
jgi:hypothetical protein